MSRTPSRLLVWLYRQVIRLAPHRLRNRFGEEQAALFEDVWQEERPRGSIQSYFFTLRLFRKAIGAVCLSWIDVVGDTLSQTRGAGRDAVRTLFRSPWYTFGVTATLAIAVALATVVFAIVDGVLFKPLPYPSPNELYELRGHFEGHPRKIDEAPETASPKEIAKWAEVAGDIPVTGISYSSLSLPDLSVAYAAAIDRRFFDVFGVRLLSGGFSDDDFISQQPVMPVIISHRVWKAHFEGSFNIIGRTFQPFAVGQSYRIVGIMAEDGFVPPVPTDSAGSRRLNRIDFLRPPFDSGLSERTSAAFTRVRPEQRERLVGQLDRALADIRQATPTPQATLSPLQRRAQAPFDRLELVPLRDAVSARERPMFVIAFGMVMCLVGLVLLNAGALAAARTNDRRRELLLRRALGAGTFDLLQRALVEQMVLAAIATAAGVVIAPILLAAVLDRLPDGTNLVKEARVDWRVLLFGAVVASISAISVALLCVRVAIRNTAKAPQINREGGTTLAGTRAGRLLTSGQIAIAFVLVLGGVLSATSMAHLWNEDPGFQFRNVATLEVVYPGERVTSRTLRVRAFDLAEDLRAMPGVRQAGVFDGLVMQNVTQLSRTFQPPVEAAVTAPVPAAISVSGGFFAATGIEAIGGRLPSDAELDTGAPVVVVSESIARAYWPGASALGRILTARTRTDFTVIGVVRDIRLVALDVPATGVIFWPFALHDLAQRGPRMIVSLRGDSTSALAAVRGALEQVSPGVRVRSAELLKDAMADTIRGRRLGAFAAQAFGIVALVFLGVGILGLVAMTTTRRTREMGVRLALGDAPAGIRRLLVREQLVTGLAGLFVGGVLAALVLPVVGLRPYAVSVYDPSVWALASVVVICTSWLGVWLPGHRISNIDVVAALRDN